MDLIIRSVNDRPVVKKVIIKKLHFLFGTEHIGCIRVLRRKSNIYVIFEDLYSKTITCQTSGSAGTVGSRRVKRDPQAVESIFKVVYPYLKAYGIKTVQVKLNTRLNGCYYTLLRELEFYGISVSTCSILRRIAFNGCRGKKLRRI